MCTTITSSVSVRAFIFTMPLYEYGCSACGTTSEISHRLSDPSPVECPRCGEPKLSKLISAAGFRLKGAGWYETDFKSDNKRNLAGESADAKPDKKSDGAADGGGKTESSTPAAASCGTGACGACS
jgi:putative FmdB family regulatory protein